MQRLRAAMWLLLGLPMLASAGSPIVCDPQDVCPGPDYPLVTGLEPQKDDMCGGDCAAPGDALNVSLDCYTDHGEIFCAAWPRTADAGYPITYEWQAMGDVIGGSDWTDAADAAFTCAANGESHGRVRVTVRSPFGILSSTGRVVSCD